MCMPKLGNDVRLFLNSERQLPEIMKKRIFVGIVCSISWLLSSCSGVAYDVYTLNIHNNTNSQTGATERAVLASKVIRSLCAKYGFDAPQSIPTGVANSTLTSFRFPAANRTLVPSETGINQVTIVTHGALTEIRIQVADAPPSKFRLTFEMELGNALTATLGAGSYSFQHEPGSPFS